MTAEFATGDIPCAPVMPGSDSAAALGIGGGYPKPDEGISTEGLGRDMEEVVEGLKSSEGV